jgi:hypothetical protein
MQILIRLGTCTLSTERVQRFLVIKHGSLFQSYSRLEIFLAVETGSFDISIASFYGAGQDDEISGEHLAVFDHDDITY